MSDWTLVEHELPPENVEVETISPKGNPGRLVRLGDLWFVPGMSMYVYYTPKFWRAG